MRKTKIICTIGPASRDAKTLAQLIASGMNIARLNMSHGEHEEHRQVMSLIRELSGKQGLPVAILGDLQGPKIRLGEIMDSQWLQEGEIFILTEEQVLGNSKKACVDHPDFCDDVFPGGKVYINDGLIQLEVLDVSNNEAKTRVVVGGELKAHKGVNLPGAKVSLPPLTDKDHVDLKFLMDEGVDFIACSFIRTEDNIKAIKQIMLEREKDIPLIAKLETREGISNSRSILDISAGIMVARGDLAVELPFEEIPLIQKVLLELGKEMRKPVIVATQMLESMTERPTPTRAEMTDVANAVIDGAWAVMLSGETAAGRYPVEAVKAMVRLVERTEEALEDGKIGFEDLGRE